MFLPTACGCLSILLACACTMAAAAPAPARVACRCPSMPCSRWAGSQQNPPPITMQVEQAATAGAKRSGPPLAPEQAATEQLAHLDLSEARAALSGSSSDKRQRRVQGLAMGSGGDDEPTSTLLPLQPLTAEAAQRMQRQGSPELEEEEEGAALAAMLAPQPADVNITSGGSGGGEPNEDPLLAQLSGSSSDAFAGSDADMAADPGGAGGGGSSGSPGAPPGSPQAAAAAAADQQHPQGPGQRQAQPDPIIRHLAQQEDAAPIQLLDVDALSKNPRLLQYQLQRAAEQQAQQRARALAAAASLRQHGELGRKELEALAEGVLPPS